MRRREFLGVLGGAATWPVVARAQRTERVRRISALTGVADEPVMRARLAAFQQGLQQLGWTEGRNVHFDYRFGGGNSDTIRNHAAELAALSPDVILGIGFPATERLIQATRTVPIVFVIVPDPVGSGFVDSLSQPGGNATGFMQFEYSLSGKWLELLKQIAPSVTRAAILWDPAISRWYWAVRDNPVSRAITQRRVEADLRARREHNRAGYLGLRALLQWRFDRNGERLDDLSSRTDCRACGTTQAACGL
jgi:putative tryptophan/tyrosine transport system substrate-binding protein